MLRYIYHISIYLTSPLLLTQSQRAPREEKKRPEGAKEKGGGTATTTTTSTSNGSHFISTSCDMGTMVWLELIQPTSHTYNQRHTAYTYHTPHTYTHNLGCK